MLMSLLNAYDPYAPSLRARRDRTKEAPFEPFVIGSALERPNSARGNASDAHPEEDAPEEEGHSNFDAALAAVRIFGGADEEADEVMPEDAVDGLGLCALLQAAATE